MMELQEEQRRLKKNFKDGKEDQKAAMMEYHQEQQEGIKNTHQTLIELQEEQRRAKKAVSNEHAGTQSAIMDLQKDQGARNKMIRELQGGYSEVQQAIRDVQESQKSVERIPLEQSYLPPDYQTEKLENLMHKEQEARKAAIVELQQEQRMLMQDTREVLTKVQEEQRKAKKTINERDNAKTATVEQLKEEQATFQKRVMEEQEDQRAAIAKLQQEQRNFNNGFRDSLKDLRGEQVNAGKAITVEQDARKVAILDLKQEQRTLYKGTKELLIEQLEEQRAANWAITSRQDDSKSAMNLLQEENRAVDKLMKQEKERQKTALMKMQEEQKTFKEKTRQQQEEQKAALMELLQGQRNFNKNFRESLAQLDKELEKVKHAIKDEQQKAVPKSLSDEANALEAPRFTKLREKQLQKEVDARKALETLLREEQKVWQGQQAIIGKLHWDVHQMKLEKQLEEVRNRKNEQDFVIENIKQNIKRKVFEKLNDMGEKNPSLVSENGENTPSVVSESSQIGGLDGVPFKSVLELVASYSLG